MSEINIPFVNPYSFVPLQTELKDRSKKRNARPSEGNLSGKIKYTITTRTPLFIPNTSNDKYFGINAKDQDEENYHKSFDFFSYNDLSGEIGKADNPYHIPVIPGSEIRGAVRSLYEILTDSCLSAYDEPDYSRRTPERYKPGLLKKDANGKWMLVPAYDYICRDENDFSVKKYSNLQNKDGTAVKFKFIGKNRKRSENNKWSKPLVEICDSGDKTGYVIKGEDGPELKPNKQSYKKLCPNCPQTTQIKCKNNGQNYCYSSMKHIAHVISESRCNEYGFNQKLDKILVQPTEEDIKKIDKILEIYTQNNECAFKEYIKTWKEIKGSKSAGVIPVYYNILNAQNGKRVLLSPACITREIYQNGLADVLGEYYKTCSDSERACPACSLFGMLNTKSNEALSSRVRFADLIADTKSIGSASDYYDQLLTLDELGTPKPSSMEFYLRKPNNIKLKSGEKILVWTWDYYIVVNTVSGETRLVAYTPEISGRKIYWHSMKAAERQKLYKEVSQKNADFITKRNKTIRPVKKKINFSGEVYFDNISEDELKQLISILNMSSIGEGKYGIKIGAAKPLGFGSVELRVQEVLQRKVSMNEGGIRYEEIPFGQRPSLSDKGLFEGITADILKVLSFDAINENIYNVHYPYIDWNKCASGEEGFKWFVENRKAFKYGRKQGRQKMVDDSERIDISSDNSGPAERKQVPYRKYMEPLKTELTINFTVNK